MPFQGNRGEDFEAADCRRQRCPQSGLEQQRGSYPFSVELNPLQSFPFLIWHDEKEHIARITQLVEEGVTPHGSFEITLFSDYLPRSILSLFSPND